MGPNNQQNGLFLAAPGYHSFGMLIHQWNHVVPILWGSHHYDRCALTALSGTNVCRFLLSRASKVRLLAYSCSGTRNYLGALRGINPERISSPQLILIRWHHLEISPHNLFKPGGERHETLSAEWYAHLVTHGLRPSSMGWPFDFAARNGGRSCS